MQRRLTTILAADVVGYSRLAAADEEGIVSRLRALRHELIDPVIAAHNGCTFKTTGDGRLTEFPSVVDAVRAALEVQRGMAQRNANVAPETRLLFRVGIHLGDVIVEGDGDLMGDGVNIAARLEGIAEPGGICLSEDSYRQVRDKIAADFADLGERELKNIARPVRVYSISPAPLHSSPSPLLGGEGRVRGAAPSQPTSPSHRFAMGPSLSPLKGGEGKTEAPRLSIVVLPFANIGGDPEQDYFVDGVTESLTTDLSRIAGSFVIARNTAFTYKGKSFDVKQIGRELGVRYVLEGSVQRGGNRMRVNVQLIEAESGAHLWAERFDKPLADLFDMQDEIVARLANQLNAQLLAAEARRAERSANPDAVDLCFRGWAAYNLGLGAANFDEGIRCFDQALAIEPDNVEALIGAGWLRAQLMFGSLVATDAAEVARCEARVRRALALAADNAVAHMVLGDIQAMTGRPDDSIAECEHALRLNPNLAPAHAVLGMAKWFRGDYAEVEHHVAQAFRLSPRDPRHWFFHTIAAHAQGAMGRFDEAAASSRRSIEANPKWGQSYFLLAACLAMTGKIDEARRAVAEGLAVDPDFTVRRRREAFPPDVAARFPWLFDGMRKAGLPEG